MRCRRYAIHGPDPVGGRMETFWSVLSVVWGLASRGAESP